MRNRILINRNEGFFSDFLTALVGIMYSHDTNKDFYVDWRSHLYSSDSEKNLFNEFFYQKSTEKDPYDETYNNITPYGYYFPKHIGFTTNEQFYSLYKAPSKILHELNILNSPFINSINRNIFNNYKVLGVHKRGTDHGYHGNLLLKEYYKQKIDYHLDKFNYDKIFLITDEVDSVDYFKNIYKDMLITTNSFRSPNQTPIHRYSYKEIPYREKLAYDVLRDAIMLSLCNFKLVSKSNVSTFSLLCNLNIDDFEYIDNTIEYR
jgi:hypothetical protein